MVDPAPQNDPQPLTSGHQGAAPAALKVETLRILLKHLHTPHRLDTPQIRALLAAHRRLPPSLSPTAVGQAAAQLLTDQIAAVDPGPDAPAPQRLPHQVLHTCFVRARKNSQAAAELGLSERQLSRERERALRLLAAELAAPLTPHLEPEAVPSIDDHIRRGDLLRALSEAAATCRLVGVTGAVGMGKTSLVAALAHALGPDNVWWHRIRPGINDSLEALLFELGHPLAREGSPELRDLLAGRIGDVDPATASRLALQGLAGRRRLLVFDDFDAGEAELTAGWLEEIVERLPLVSVVTIGRPSNGAAVVEVERLSRAETAQVFRAYGVSLPSGVLDAVHQLGGGCVGIIACCATWWSGHAQGLSELERQLARQHPAETLGRLVRFQGRAA